MTRQTARRSLGALILVVMAASAIYGGGFFGLRERFSPPSSRTTASPFGTPVNQDAAPAQAASRRSQPYWVPVSRFQGTGPLTTPAFAIDPRAIQWRVRWRCERAAFRIQPQRPSGEAYGHPLAGASCPKAGVGQSVAGGQFKLDIGAEGAWQAQVEQQVDVPLVEPPTPAMTSPDSRVVASGRFYDIDEKGTGSVKIYRERDGSTSLRLGSFYVTPNVDLEIRFSELERPKSTRQVARAPFKDIVFLKATAGSMNYRIPPGTLSDRVRSVVIWCEITHNAYAAASLRG